MALTVTIDGIRIAGLMQASITSTNYFSSDSFSLSFAIGTAPLNDLGWWSYLESGFVDISYAETEFSTSNTIISGRIDTLVADPILKTVSIEGRDLSASLIDSYVQQDFVNQTASEIIQTVAFQHGLVALATATFGNVGRYFGDGYTKLSLGEFSNLCSNWDLVVQLAREREFDVFVQDRVLYFQPEAGVADPWIVIGPADVTAMRVERTLALDTAANIRVQSWNSQHMTSYSANTSNGELTSSTGSVDPGGQSYLFSGPNLTPEQTDLLSQRLAGEISRLRTIIHIEMLWERRFSTRSVILLRGTGSSFDGCYKIDALERHYSTVSGSRQTVRAISWPGPSSLTLP